MSIKCQSRCQSRGNRGSINTQLGMPLLHMISWVEKNGTVVFGYTEYKTMVKGMKN